jgi:hypothetical protein
VVDSAFAPHAFRQFDLRCTGCGYGAAAPKEPPRCPMCGGTTWDFEVWRPFSDISGSGIQTRKSAPAAMQ